MKSIRTVIALVLLRLVLVIFPDGDPIKKLVASCLCKFADEAAGAKVA